MLIPITHEKATEIQVCSLLGIDSYDQIAHQAEIPPSELEKSLRDIYHDRSEYEKIIFQQRGMVELLDWRKNINLYFGMAAISHYKKSWFANGIMIELIDDDRYEKRNDRIFIRKPWFFINNIDTKKNPLNKKEN